MLLIFPALFGKQNCFSPRGVARPTDYWDCVPNVTDIYEDDGAQWSIGVSNPIFRFEEITMLGYGLIGTLVIICLIVWLVRRVA
jgi:hypothetical protein